MIIFSLIFSALSTIICGILCIKVFKSLKYIKDLDDYVNGLESEITTLESHTNGAFKGAYFLMEDLKSKLLNHCHSYEFNDGVLYIQEPIITENEDVNNSNDETED